MPYKVKGQCVYKKDTGAKVGCTKGSVDKYLAALHANADINESNTLKGGKADKLTPKEIADKFNLSTSKVTSQITKGEKVESEHTNNKGKAKEIAMDHVSEFPDYYDRLEKMEKQAEKYWKTKLTEDKKVIKKLLRENLDNKQNVEQQIQAELERLGLPSDTKVYISGKIDACSKEVAGSMNEGLKDMLVNLAVVCSIAAGSVSCQKANKQTMYRYVYDTEQSIQYAKEHKTDVRSTCLAPYDHVLSPEELSIEQEKLAQNYKYNNNINVMNDTLVPIDAPMPSSPAFNK
jgi:predicted DNA-binding protein YlxM (UPF0122 family)